MIFFKKVILTIVLLGAPVFSQINYKFSVYEDFPELLALEKDYDFFLEKNLKGKVDSAPLRTYLSVPFVTKRLEEKIKIIESYETLLNDPQLKNWLSVVTEGLRLKELKLYDLKVLEEFMINYYDVISVIRMYLENSNLDFDKKLLKKVFEENSARSLYNLLKVLKEKSSEVFKVKELKRGYEITYNHGDSSFYYRSGYMTDFSNSPLRDAKSAVNREIRANQYITTFYTNKEVSIQNIIEIYLSGAAVIGAVEDHEQADGVKRFPVAFADHDKFHGVLLAQEMSIFAPLGKTHKTSREKLKEKLKPYLEFYKKSLKELEGKTETQKIGFLFFWLNAVHESGYLFRLDSSQYEMEMSFVKRGASRLLKKNNLGSKSIWGIDYNGSDIISKKEAEEIVEYAHMYRRQIMRKFQSDLCEKKLAD